MSTRDKAVALAKQGFRVFPLAIGGKVPALDTDWKWLASRDPAKVEALWTDPVFDSPIDYNIGVALPGDIVVVDVDVRDGKRGNEALQLLETIYDPLPGTYEVETASGGRHKFLRTDSPLANGKLAEHVDVKSLGGYVVGEGSIVDGKPYRRIAGSPSTVAAAPEWIGGLVGGARRQAAGKGVARETTIELDTPEAVRRATEWVARQVEVDGGGRYRAACRVLDFGVSEAAAYEIMAEYYDPDGLEEKIAHAWRYRKDPVGVSSAEVEFGGSEGEGEGKGADVTGKRGKLYFEWFADVKTPRTSSFLIEDWYDQEAMVVTYGESNSGKSHVVLNQAFAIASGGKWNGKEVVQGLVVYVAAEGGRGIKRRIEAYQRRAPGQRLPLALVPCPVDLLRPNGDTRGLIALVKAAEAQCGQPCRMVVLDTLSRVLAGGNENGPEDMGALVGHCDRIRKETGATVHLIHHSGKNAASGARGHSLLRAATDTEIEIAEGVVTSRKQRDMDTPREMTFSLEVVELGVDDRGKKITAAVAVVSSVNDFEAKITPAAERFLCVLRDLLEDRDNPEQGIPWKEWWGAVKSPENGLLHSGLSRPRCVTLRNQLSQFGAVKKLKGNQWVTAERNSA